MAITNNDSIPVAISTNSAETHEIKLVEKTIDHCLTEEAPNQIIGDLAYDSDPLDETLRRERNIDLIAPHKSNRTRPKTQDGRSLRKYKRRWKVERVFAWIQNFRRVQTRYEYYEENFLGMEHLACIVIILLFLR